MARRIQYLDDDTESVETLFRLRIPPLIAGLLLGIGISVLASNFEEVLSRDVRVAFFLPFVVYIAAAVGSQTANIYTRDMEHGRARFHTYLAKESALGVILGTVFGGLSAGIISVWLGDSLLALSVGFSTLAAVSAAPLVALLITETSKWFREDPAAEAGPIGTVFQDMLSVLIYGSICSAIILR